MRTTPDSELDTVATRWAEMPPKKVARLEALVRADDADAELRARLAGYYFLHTKSPGVRAKRTALIRWFVKRDSASPFLASPYVILQPGQDPKGHRTIRAFWVRHAAGTTDVAVLKNAAAFFRFASANRCIRYLERAERLAPRDTRLKELLGNMWKARASTKLTGPKQRAAGQRALGYYEKAYRLTKGSIFKWYRLDALARAALLAGKHRKAAQYARTLVADAEQFTGDWNYGNAVHNCNETLGQLALRQGRRGEALNHLAAAGASRGSPQLNSFGPEFFLARELLKLGERDAVLDYLEGCAKFWSMGRDRLSKWAAELRAGGSPKLER